MSAWSTDRGLFDGLWWNAYAREGVHGPLHRVAGDAFHGVEDLLGELGLLR